MPELVPVSDRFPRMSSARLSRRLVGLACLIACLMTLAPAALSRERVFYLTAEETDWDYFPEAGRTIDVATMDERQKATIVSGPNRVGTRYRKVVYRAYTDDSFSEPVPQPEWQGLLGPTLHVEVGDTLRIVLRNNAARPYGIHLRNLAPAPGDPGPVPPGETRTFSWTIPPQLGPGPEDGSSIAWPYFSNVDALRDIHSGLIGALVVTRRGLASRQGIPLDVDRELVILAAVFDENLSWYLPDNLRRPDAPVTREPSPAFEESNRMHSINGLMHASLPMPRLEACERVRIYSLAMNTGMPGIALAWQGNTLLRNGHRTDVIPGTAGTAAIAQMTPYNPGVWIYGAARADLQYLGMWATYQVRPAEAPCK